MLYITSIMEVSSNTNMISNISEIKHVYYINLDNRPDRKVQVEQEIHSIGIDKSAVHRFSAIELLDGALGCSLSHLKCIQQAKLDNWPHVLILEDDVQFTNVEIFKVQFDKLLQTQTDWDVILLAGNNRGPYRILSDCAVQIQACLTTTGYLVKREYYDALIDNFTASIKSLISTPTLRRVYAIDVYWQHLQVRDKWLLVYPLFVTQRPNYSNIEKKYTNYDMLMLTLDKSTFRR
jgi:GR25 family glycosyltransferase involved in LPS biosynthesis